jgi:hypothetical protein
MATRADIRGLARIRADQDSSTFPTDTQYNTLIDFAARRVWRDLIKAGWPVNFSSVDKAATGTNPITLASGTVAFIAGVYRVEGSTVTELRRLNEGDRDSLSSQTGTAEFYNVVYDPTNGACLELFPIPSSGTYRVKYLTSFGSFANDAATWPGPDGSDEMLAVKAAAAGCRKEGNDQGAKQLDDEYADLLVNMQELAAAFDLRNPPTIRDVGGGLLGRRDPFDYDV